MAQDKSMLQKVILEKGLQYFIEGASKEDKERFEGTLFRNGYPNLSLIQRLSA